MFRERILRAIESCSFSGLEWRHERRALAESVERSGAYWASPHQQARFRSGQKVPRFIRISRAGPKIDTLGSQVIATYREHFRNSMRIRTLQETASGVQDTS